MQSTQITDDYLWRRAQVELGRDDFSWWVSNSGLMLDGRPFSFDGHEYLREPYSEIRNHQEFVLEKAAQMGLSTLEILNAYHGTRNGAYPHGVLYLLPSKSDVTEFSKSKAQNIVDENPQIASWITDTDAANIKKVGGGYIYFRGMQSRVGLKTVTVNAVIFDEIEEVEDWSMVALAEERMSHVENPITHRLSVPSIPGYGIDSYFAGSPETGIQASDQRFWTLKCQACGEWTCLEDEFPDCIVEVSKKEERAIRVCRKCQRELDISIGEWVPKEPDRRVMGYHFSQLFSRYINPWKLLDQFRSKRDLTTLFNDKLGIPYVESEARLEADEVLSICGSTQQLAAFEGPAAMGVDQPKAEGGNFHVVVAYKQENRPCIVARVCVRNTWKELSDLIKIYNVGRCVVDGLPDQSKAREFAKAHYGKVFLSYYAEKQKGAPKWNENDWTVSVDRTEIHNTLTRMVHDRSMSLPLKDQDVITLSKHLHNMARKKEEDKDTGSVRHVWVKTGPDHYRHAGCYCLLALQDLGEYVPPKTDKDWDRDRRKIGHSWKTL